MQFRILLRHSTVGGAGCQKTLSRATAAFSPSCSFAVLEVCCPGVWRSGVSLSGWNFAVPEFCSPSGVSLFRSFAVLQFAVCLKFRCPGISQSVWSFIVLEFRRPAVCCLSGVLLSEFRSPSGVLLFWSFAVLQFAGISLSRNFAVRLEFRCCLEFRREEFHGPVVWRSGESFAACPGVSLPCSFAFWNFAVLKFHCPGVSPPWSFAV